MIDLKNMPDNAFTVSFNGISGVLICEIGVRKWFEPAPGVSLPPLKKFTAVWDTGATHSAVTQKVIDECKLLAVGMAEVESAHGSQIRPVFKANIILPNNIEIPSLKVTLLDDIRSADILIGMDIIHHGDFAVSNFDGKTVFSFRIPSRKVIDFVPESNKYNESLQKAKRLKSKRKSRSNSKHNIHPALKKHR